MKIVVSDDALGGEERQGDVYSTVAAHGLFHFRAR